MVGHPTAEGWDAVLARNRGWPPAADDQNDLRDLEREHPSKPDGRAQRTVGGRHDEEGALRSGIHHPRPHRRYAVRRLPDPGSPIERDRFLARWGPKLLELLDTLETAR